jgi:hypothetical protein
VAFGLVVLGALAAPAMLKALVAGAATSPAAVRDVLRQKQFTIYVNGRSKSLTFPEVLARYNPDTRQFAGGMLFDMGGAPPMEVEVLRRTGPSTCEVRCWIPKRSVPAKGFPDHPEVHLRVDTATKSVEPLDENASRYLAVDGARFE